MPVLMSAKNLICISKIRSVIRAKIQAAAHGCLVGEHIEEIRLQNAMFVMAEFRPRIGKQHEKARHAHPVRKGFKQKPRFSADKMQI